MIERRVRKGQAVKCKSETERAIYAAMFVSHYNGGTKSIDNSTAEEAIVEAEWAVECHRQAIREQKRWRAS